MNSILNSLDTEESFNILNKTSEQIFQEKYNAINELDLEEEILNKLLNQLDNYIYIDELNDVIYGSYLKWIPLSDVESIKLTKGGVVTDVTIGQHSPIIKCKNFSNKCFAFDFNKSIVFRKLSNQENVLLSVANYLNK